MNHIQANKSGRKTLSLIIKPEVSLKEHFKQKWIILLFLIYANCTSVFCQSLSKNLEVYFVRETKKTEYNMFHYFEVRGLKDRKVQENINHLLKLWLTFDHKKFLQNEYPRNNQMQEMTDYPPGGQFALDTNFSSETKKIYWILHPDILYDYKSPIMGKTDTLTPASYWGYKYSIIADSFLVLTVMSPSGSYSYFRNTIYINLNTATFVDFYSNFKPELISKVREIIDKKVQFLYKFNRRDEFGLWGRIPQETTDNLLYYEGTGNNPHYVISPEDSNKILVAVEFRKNFFTSYEEYNTLTFHEKTTSIYTLIDLDLKELSRYLIPNSLIAALLNKKK